jgi:AP2 domain
VKGVPLQGKYARGRVTWVSERDYDRAMTYRWYCWEERRPNGSIHGPIARTTIRLPDGRYIKLKLHQMIMGCDGVDHRNGYPLDNTRPNLRKADGAENQRNQGPRRGGTSNFKGVDWDSGRQRWRAQIQAGKIRRCRRFTAEEDAARWYDAMATELHGAFARLNFPQVASPAARVGSPAAGSV